MEHYELIRRKVIIEGKSQRDVAKELHHSRETITKALELRIPPGYRLNRPRQSLVIEPVRHIIDAWLEQNRHARPKQRQTGMRIYERLQDEHGFKGHYGTVQRYVRQAANRQKEVFMPLQFEPGEEIYTIQSIGLDKCMKTRMFSRGTFRQAFLAFQMRMEWLFFQMFLLAKPVL